MKFVKIAEGKPEGKIFEKKQQQQNIQKSSSQKPYGGWNSNFA